MLLGDDDAGVVTSRLQEFGVKPAEIGGVVSELRAALTGRPSQLRFIRDFTQAALAGRRDIRTAISQRANERLSLRVFIQVKTEFAHTAALPAGAFARRSRSSAR